MAPSSKTPSKKTSSRKKDSRKLPDVMVPNAGLRPGQKAVTEIEKAQRLAERINRNRAAAERSRAKGQAEEEWKIDMIARLRRALLGGPIDPTTMHQLQNEVFTWDDTEYEAALAALAAQEKVPADSPDDQQSSNPAVLPTPELNTGRDLGAPMFPPEGGVPSQLGMGGQFEDTPTSPTDYSDGLEVALNDIEMSGQSYQTGSQNPFNFRSNVTITGGQNVFYASLVNNNLAFSNSAVNGSAFSNAPLQRAPDTASTPATSSASNTFPEPNLGYPNYGYQSNHPQTPLPEMQREPSSYLSGEVGAPDAYNAIFLANYPHLDSYAPTSVSYVAPPGPNTFRSGPSREARDPASAMRRNPYAAIENVQQSPEGPCMSQPPSYDSVYGD